MDYEMKPASRNDLRLYAKLFRSIIGVRPNDPIDPEKLLDKLPDFEGFSDVWYEVVCDNELPSGIPAQCIKNEDGYTIQIKESVLKAYKSCCSKKFILRRERNDEMAI